MRITPVDEAAYQKRGPWRGWYPCTVLACAEGTSRAGNPYLRCDVAVVNESGDRRTIVDYLMASGRGAWRLRSAAEAFGVLERYQAGEIGQADFLNATAFARLGVEADTQRNVIREYAAEIPSVARAALRQELRDGLKKLYR